MLYRDLYIWLRVPGGVAGVNLEWLNDRIDYYNRNEYLRSTGDFWGWLSWDAGETFEGFDAIWNAGSRMMDDVHYIKGGNNNER